MMIIIGERINCSRTRIREAVLGRDEGRIGREVRRQAAAGAAFIDVNAATGPDTELDSMRWLMEVVQRHTSLPVSVDSVHPQVLKAALEGHRNGRPIVNSISGETDRIERILPLAAEHRTFLIALTMDDSGMPQTNDQRLAALEGILRRTDAAGVARGDIFVDPLIRPICTNPGHAMDCLEMIRRVKVQFGCRTTGGFSNISFGLPGRRLLNVTYMAMAIAAGLDSAVTDPTEPGMMATICAAETLAGRDEWCMNYITAQREGRLD